MRVPSAFRERWRTDAGSYIQGVRGRPETSDSGSEGGAFPTTRLTFRVSPASPLRGGVVIVSPEGDRYLTIGTGAGSVSRLYRLLALDRRVSWKRVVTDIHPVTKQKVSSGEQELGPIWISLSALGEIEEAGKFDRNLYRVVTNADLRLNDTVDGMTIKRVQKLHEVTVAEVV